MTQNVQWGQGASLGEEVRGGNTWRA